MAYCTVQELRDAGIQDCHATEALLLMLIAEACATIDRATGWFFESRALTLKVDGRGTRWLHLPFPIVTVTEVRHVQRLSDPDLSVVVDADLFVVYNRRPDTDGMDDRYNPKIVLIGHEGHEHHDFGHLHHGHIHPGVVGHRGWLSGRQNYEVDGTFGFVDPDGLGGFVAPPEIRRACRMLVFNDIERGAKNATVLPKHDLRSITVQGRSETYQAPATGNTITGVPEVDRLLLRYRRPPAVEAA